MSTNQDKQKTTQAKNGVTIRADQCEIQQKYIVQKRLTTIHKNKILMHIFYFCNYTYMLDVSFTLFVFTRNL